MIEDVLLNERMLMIFFFKEESWLKEPKNHAVSVSGNVECSNLLKEERSFLAFEREVISESNT